MSLEVWMAERILKRSGVSPTPQIEELLVRLLKSAREGHLCISIENPSHLPQSLWSNGSIKTPLVIQDGRLYLQRNWALETAIVEKVVQLRSRTQTSSDSSLFLKELANVQDRLDPAQAEALSSSFFESLSIFTGGPGTGKTYTASLFIRLLAAAKQTSFKVAVAAPTGKAAAQLESTLQSQGKLAENLRLEATTLHRLLKLAPGRQRLDGEFFIDADLVVVDEASMLDVSLLLHLLSAIGPETKLLLLGDPDQLPPVESGSLFTQLAELFGHRLRRSIRMGEGNLFALAQAINEGNLAQVKTLLASGGETARLEADFSLAQRDALVDLLAQKLPSPLFETEPNPQDCLQQQAKFRILSGLRQGLLGIDELNRLLTERYTRAFSRWLALPILIAKTDLRQNLYNGTPGVLIRRSGQRMGTAYFALLEGLQTIPEGALPHYEIGFCLSVHKAQGSEFDEILALFPPGSERFGKELLYTAITRAKKKATLMIDDLTLSATLSTPSKRESGLLKRYLPSARDR
jgi:exodeoxyribonuclease V alpha subunit